MLCAFVFLLQFNILKFLFSLIQFLNSHVPTNFLSNEIKKKEKNYSASVQHDSYKNSTRFPPQ